ncbi:MAG: cell division protein FtsW [Anaerolineaceae bacterium]|nr:cell division protein FtsW [Anaerolineaceae bacterium]
MTDHTTPHFIDQDADTPMEPVIRATPRSTPKVAPVEPVPTETRRGWWASLDTYMLIVIGSLLAISLLMVYSTTFDWSYLVYGDELVKFTEHMRNIGIGLLVMLLMAFINYRLWRRLAVLMLLVTIGTLIAVLQFGDDTFGARRALINGSLQPGELAEYVIVIYMAAWLSSRRTQIRSITYGLLPFAVLVGIVGGLVMLQPDLSTAATIFVVSGIMFFLAGADIIQLLVMGTTIAGAGIVWITNGGVGYAQDRIQSFISGSSDVTQASYQVQAAIQAFISGGWTGRGLGQSLQKFQNLPAPHTDSIFAVIGEELGVLGAALVIALYIALVIRGLQIARRSPDSFGALLASGITIWIAVKALLNIAVMTGVMPPTGATLPFISFGGSSMVVLLSGVGMMLSVARQAQQQKLKRPERSTVSAYYDRGGWDRRPRVSGAGNRRSSRHTAPGN